MGSRDRTGEGSLGYLVAVGGVGGAIVIATRRGRPATRSAALALAGFFGATIYGARRMFTNAVAEASRREDHQRILVDAQLGQALGGAHGALNAVEPELRRLLADPALPAALAPSIEDALRTIAALAETLRRSAPARDALVDEDGVVPLVGIGAARRHAGGPRAVRPLYGARDGLPRFVPDELRALARQVGLVLDETRLLHTAEVERAVLFFTLFSRAVLVPLSPLLGAWSPVRQPLAGGFGPTDVPWLAASSVAVATALAGHRVVGMAMDGGPEGRSFRRRALLIEAPIAASALVFSPSWTVVVFASGVTNWWQRQSKDMAFHWGKLVAYGGAVIVLQGAGLARAGVAPGIAAVEIGGALLALLVTGASYGAMLPLTIGTAVDVLVGDGRRSLGGVIQARGELLGAGRQLQETAAAIDAAAPGFEAAGLAAATARRAALQIERAADRAGRRGLMSSQLLPELSAEAIARSFLPRRDTSELAQLQRRALDSGEPAPAYATEPIFLPVELVEARVARQRHARALRGVVEHGLNEAGRHGTGGVRLIVVREDEELRVRIGNRVAPGDRPGIAGRGAADLGRLAGRLPGGRLERGLRPAAAVRMPAGGEWWVVELRCSIEVLTGNPDW